MENENDIYRYAAITTVLVALFAFTALALTIYLSYDVERKAIEAGLHEELTPTGRVIWVENDGE